MIWDKYPDVLTYEKKAGKDKYGNIVAGVKTNENFRYCGSEQQKTITDKGEQYVMRTIYHSPFEVLIDEKIGGKRVVEVSQSVDTFSKKHFWRVWVV